MTTPLLDVKGLKTYFFTEEGTVPAVDGIDFFIHEGESLGVVGESGCGKTVTARSIMRLVPQPPGRIMGGEILWQGTDLLTLSAREMRKIRGKDISMVLQDPMTNLNPVFTAGEQIAEAIRLHMNVNKREAMDRTIEMLKTVGIPSPERRVKDYPHQLSGGMRQRVMIAMALSCNPRLVIADEPTTALDVTIQAQILELIAKLKEELKMAIILITHNLGVVAEATQRIIVMYAGQIIEEADVRILFHQPLHPYTKGLLKSIPRLDSTVVERRPLESIPGVVANMLNLPQGCRFAQRCNEVMDICTETEPPVSEKIRGRKVKCWLVEEGR
jgi:oligopeptide/dipeptide ABC transporter ATP-binding protein